MLLLLLLLLLLMLLLCMQRVEEVSHGHGLVDIAPRQGGVAKGLVARGLVVQECVMQGCVLILCRYQRCANVMDTVWVRDSGDIRVLQLPLPLQETDQLSVHGCSALDVDQIHPLHSAQTGQHILGSQHLDER